MLGFDADHCLVKYNIAPMVSLLMKIMAEDLVDMGYPSEVTQYEGKGIEGLVLNNCLWDIENMTILELGEGKVIMTAYKGTRMLSGEEIA